MNKKHLGTGIMLSAAVALSGSTLSVVVASPAEAAHIVIIPRAPIMRVTPRIGPSMRYRGSAATSYQLFWWPWSAPCKKDKRGNCR